MIRPEDLSRIGYVKRTHGVKGELQIALNTKVALNKGDFLFLSLEGHYIPYPINELKATEYQLVMRLGFVEDLEKAKEFIGAEVFVDGEVLDKDNSSLIGYMLIDDRLERIGIVEELLQFPQQQMLVVNYAGKKHMIPFVEPIVKSVSTELKEIYCNLPEGLLEL